MLNKLKRRLIHRYLFDRYKGYALHSMHNESRKRHLLVACMPKSGSTYLTTMLSSLDGFRNVSLVPSYGRREQELDTLALMSSDEYDYSAQHHVRYSEETHNLMYRFGVKPVVLVRNIFDVVFSIRDHVRKESVVGPAGYVFPHMTNWPDEKLEEFIVDICIPWDFNFFLTWQECQNKCLITYEALLADPFVTIDKINKHFLLNLSEKEIGRAIDVANGKPTRKNIGNAGRGEQLNDYCKQRIQLMANYYSGVDFSLIGIKLKC